MKEFEGLLLAAHSPHHRPSFLCRMHKLKTQGSLFEQNDAWRCLAPECHPLGTSLSSVAVTAKDKQQTTHHWRSLSRDWTQWCMTSVCLQLPVQQPPPASSQTTYKFCCYKFKFCRWWCVQVWQIHTSVALAANLCNHLLSFVTFMYCLYWF